MGQEELRKCYRKKTNLEGVFKTLAPPHSSGKICITDLYAGGCSFTASSSHRLQPEEHIGIAFSLDNARGSMIRKKAIIHQVEGRHVSCEFIALHGTYDPDLGFYLRN